MTNDKQYDNRLTFTVVIDVKDQMFLIYEGCLLFLSVYHFVFERNRVVEPAALITR